MSAPPAAQGFTARLPSLDPDALCDVLSRLLRQTYTRNPASTCVFFLNAMRRPYPANFGVDCIGLSRILRESIQAAVPALDVSYLAVPNDGHHTVIAATESGITYFMDPMFMQKEAVRVPEAGRLVESGTHDRAGKLVLRRITSRTIEARWYGRDNHAGALRLLHRYRMNLDRDRRSDAPRIAGNVLFWENARLVMPAKMIKLSLRALRPPACKIAYVFDPRSGTEWIFDSDNEKVGGGDGARFRLLRSELLDLLRVTRRQFDGFIQASIDAHSRIPG